MRTREILESKGRYGYISEEDLENLRVVAARAKVAESGNPCLTFDQAFSAFLRPWALHESLRQKYKIDPDDAVDFSIYDGAILDSAWAEDQ